MSSPCQFSDLIGRIARRVQRLPGFSKVVPRLQNGMRIRQFHRDKARGERALEQFQKCVTPLDFLTLSNEILGAHQVPSEIVGFLEFARSKSPLRVAEIGTAMGGTNFVLTHALPEVTVMIGVDLFVANQGILRAFTRPGQTLHFVCGSSYAPETVEHVRGLLGGEMLDLLFIDGDHTYEGAWKDFEFYRQFVRPGGLIAFHDIAPDYQTRYGRNTGRWAGDVPILWANLKAHYHYREFIEHPDQDGLGIGVLEYDPAVALPVEISRMPAR